MSKATVGDAFSAGLGLAMGFTMAQYIFQAIKPPERLAKEVIVCLKCGSKNPAENKFCGQCGQAFYPQPLIACPKCNAKMPLNMNFCGQCGFPLRKIRRTRKRGSSKAV